MDLSQLISEFVAEAQELVASIEEDVLALEHAGLPEREELLNRLFRALHTIKGGAACVDFDAVTDFAHEMEDVVEMLRKGAVVPNPDISLALLDGVDRLKAGIASGSGRIEDPGSAVARLREISHPSGDGTAAAPSARAGGKAGRSGFDLSRCDFRGAKADGMHVYDIELDVARECARHSRTPFGLIRHLGSVGNVLATRPEGELFLRRGQDLSDCSVLLATIIDDPDILFAGLEIEPISFVHLAPGDLPDPVAEPAPRPPSPSPSPAEPDGATKAPPPPARGPEKTLRIPVEVADSLMNLAGELVVVRNRAQQLQAGGDAHEVSAMFQRLDVVTSDLQRMVMRTRMQPVGNVFGRFTRVVRDLCRTLGKEIELEVIGAEVELDKSLIDGLVEPLTHMVRNAVDHGIEPPEERRRRGKPAVGRIRLAAEHQAGMVNITVTDDGKGIDPVRLREAAVEKGLMPRPQAEGLNDREALGLIFLPGFSTAKEITELSGRGVGMDAVKAALQRLGGVVEIESGIGKGSVISIKLPLTLAIIPAIVLGVGSQRFAIPQVSVLEVVWLHGEQVWQSLQRIDRSEVYWLRGRMLPVIRLSKVLGLPRSYVEPTGEETPDRRADAPDRRANAAEEVDERRSGVRERRVSPENSLYIVVLRVGSDRFGLCVEQIVDTEEVVVKPLHERLKESEVYAGVTVLGDGTTAMILDVPELARIGGLHWEATELQAEGPRKGGGEPQKMLVFESGAERLSVPLSLLLRVDEIPPSGIQAVAGREMLRFREGVIPLLRLEETVPGLRPGIGGEGMHAIIPRIGNPVAVAATRIVDIVEVDGDALTPGSGHPALLGTLMIDGHATSLLDLCSLAVSPALPGESRSRGRILVVEDSALYASLVGALFRGIGFEAMVVSNGEEALGALGLQTFDCVVSDVEMPGMDGLELARRMRQDAAHRGLPLLGMSMLEERTMRARALGAGFDDFCQKSNLPRLAERIETLLSTPSARSSHG